MVATKWSCRMPTDVFKTMTSRIKGLDREDDSGGHQISPKAYCDVSYDLLFAAQQGRCFFCDCEMQNRKAKDDKTENRRRQQEAANGVVYIRPWTVEHLFPKKYGYIVRNNVVLACKPCNSAKGDRFPTESEMGRAMLLYAVIGSVWAPHLGLYTETRVKELKPSQLVNRNWLLMYETGIRDDRMTVESYAVMANALEHTCLQVRKAAREQRSAERRRVASLPGYITKKELNREKMVINRTVQERRDDSQELPHQGWKATAEARIRRAAEAAWNKCRRAAEQAWRAVASAIS